MNNAFFYDNLGPDRHRLILERIARRVMLEKGLFVDFPADALADVDHMQPVSSLVETGGRDLRALPWASIDNDDSRDLDQLSVAEVMADGAVKILVAVADVDHLVGKGSPLDQFASHNTTTVYTIAKIFPMLPQKLSTDLTSLNLNSDRLAIVVEMLIDAGGSLQVSDVYQASVRNKAKLAYNSVGAWLEGKSETPGAITAVAGLADNLRLQDQTAQHLKQIRHAHGALTLQTIEAKPIFDGDQIRSLEIEEKNRAKELIEDFMIAANGVTARYLSTKRFPSIRRVVRTPKRWDRIVEIAAEHNVTLPEMPDSIALENFLIQSQTADPVRFADLSLSIIKLLGAGEYVAELPEGNIAGHFGLAVRDYAHSTAPNRRYADLVTQRLLKAAMAGTDSPYSLAELQALADHCTQLEDIVNKVERQISKSAAALLLAGRVGEEFDGLVTGAAAKGTWVRLLAIPVEGRLIRGFEGIDVGHRVRVRLVAVDVDRGFIDFESVTARKGS